MPVSGVIESIILRKIKTQPLSFFDMKMSTLRWRYFINQIINTIALFWPFFFCDDGFFSDDASFSDDVSLDVSGVAVCD